MNKNKDILKIEVANGSGVYKFIFIGELVIDTINLVVEFLHKIKINEEKVIFDFEKLSRLDISGAFILKKIIYKLIKQNIKVELINIESSHKKLIDMLELNKLKISNKYTIRYKIFYNIGKTIFNFINQMVFFSSFLGEFFVNILSTFIKPKKIRINEICYEIENTGIYAIPIVSLVGLLSGVVFAYQGAAQLSKFGANIFIVDLICISISREMSPLLTSIMVAGRSGSAYTAKIGSMMLNQEIDSLKIIGISPMELLVIPKFMAMIISLPLLIFIADVVGIGSGLYLSHYLLGLDFSTMIIRLKSTLSVTNFLIGISKGILFSVPIVLISCFMGFSVKNNSEELGLNTTMSVVNTIFVVIVIDAILSIIFQKLGI